MDCQYRVQWLGEALESFEGWQLAPLNALQAECGGLKSTVQWLDCLMDAAKGLGKRLESFEAWQLAALNALKAECRGLTGLWKLPKGFGKRLESFEAPLKAIKAKSGGLTGSYWQDEWQDTRFHTSGGPRRRPCLG